MLVHQLVLVLDYLVDKLVLELVMVLVVLEDK
jgi:hypothetical protein